VAVVTEHRLRIGDRDVTLLSGPAGWGESSPLDGYPCDPRAARRAAEEAACDGWPAPLRTEVPVNALVSSHDVDTVALAGYDAVKVKMRAPTDVDLVAEVRDVVGPSVQLRVDANGAWDPQTAIDVIARLERLGVALVEQPVASLDDLAHVRRKVNIPLAADESVRSLDDARRLRSMGAADVVVLKVQPLGGVRAALGVAEAAGVPAIPTSMMETSIGVAAGLALAAALPELPFACGLGTAALLEADVTTEPLVPQQGRLQVRTVTPDAELLARYAVSSHEVTTCASSSGRSRSTA
jgi:O-succinylbenzoate synthase